jgi:ribonucleotide monophosphatase NagD (HAD superfamily)
VIDMLAVPRARILAVGDALRTDMAGAKAAGVDGCWVLGGLHGEHLGEDRARIEAEAAASGLSPVATLPRLVW